MSESKERKIKKNDFVLVEFIGRIKDNAKVFDTTVQEVAMKADIFNEREIYQPRLVVVGAGWVSSWIR